MKSNRKRKLKKPDTGRKPAYPRVGSMRQLRKNVLGNEKGTWGVCFNVIRSNSGKTYQFIFPNGNLDGFSQDDMDYFFNEDQMYCPELSGYEFKSVIKTSRDFNSDVFKIAWKYIH